LSVSTFSPDEAVRARFNVKDSFLLEDDKAEYSIAYEESTKKRFTDLLQELGRNGYTAQLSGSKKECVMVVSRREPRPGRGSRVPVIFALLTLVSVVVFSLLQETLYGGLAPGVSGYLVFTGFTLAVATILGCHELGRWLVGRRSGTPASTQYLIPGIPFLPPFLPALGFAGVQKWPAANRDKLFDLILAGPLAIVVTSAVFSVVGGLSAFQSTVTLAASNLGNSTVFVNSNLIQLGIGSALGTAAPSAAPGYVLLSPLGDVATVGFILAFVSLLPMTLFDGGHLASAVLGQRWQRAMTYLSVFLLLSLDTPSYWAVAVVVLVLAGRPAQLKLQDEVSEISRSRKVAYLVVLLVALCCIPIPGNFATLTLG
jgi:Peptidase family M50